MTSTSIYEEIAKRTSGDIYIGVVGPVRTGKSTFIKKFMDVSVIPNISDFYDRQRAVDAAPQSADGKSVMTCEPKFIPDEAVSIEIGSNTLRVKMIDCVGYMVPDASVSAEEDKPRMVMTPWSDKAMPFEEAAELGTLKVIKDHSTIGLVVTTDGSIGDIPRESYISAEERIIGELSSMNKPFAIILNSATPESKESIELAYKLEDKYNAPVALINCLQLNSEDVEHILELVLDEFPILEMRFKVPDWTMKLPHEHHLKSDITNVIRKLADNITKTGDVKRVISQFTGDENIEEISVNSILSGEGQANLTISLKNELYYKTLSELTGFDIENDAALISTMQELANIKREYDTVKDALCEVNEKGYGIVMPNDEELQLDEPKVIKQSGNYGIKLKARARSIHMIKAEIETEINPIIGTEAQAVETLSYLQQQIEENPQNIKDFNFFGRSLYDLVSDGLKSKLENMPEESREKLSETLERIINEGSGGLICILL